jgi:hypothetical protein
MNPKLKAILAAVGWAALVGALQALEAALDPPYNGIITILITVIAGIAKYSPQSAVIVNPPANRSSDDRRG